MQKWREKGNKSTGIECVYVWGVLMWKNLYLVFCFLESANNNVSENQTTVQPETKSEKSERSVESEHFATRKTYESKMFFPANFEPHFPFSLVASS